MESSGYTGLYRTGHGNTQSLSDTMRAPSNAPDVVVIDRIYDDGNIPKPPSLQQDLWVSTADGRFSSPPISIRVGTQSDMQIFYVHKEVLQRSVWFHTALCGGFREAESQSIDLPEEDPALFHFLVAFLYEKRFEPITPASSILESTVNKGKGKDSSPLITEPPARITHAVPDPGVGQPGRHYHRWRGMPPQYAQRPTPSAANQDISANPEPSGKRPGAHRASCCCLRCLAQLQSRRCWQCGASQTDEPPHQRGPAPYNPHGHGRGANWNAPPNPIQPETAPNIDVEDMSTWLMAYELHLDVYICANRYLMDDFRAAIMRSTIDMLEAAGMDAAHPTVLHLCGKLHENVPGTDPLLRMVLARVGFLQELLWKRYPEETSEIMRSNPDMVTEMLKETVSRHRSYASGSWSDLPPMETASSETSRHRLDSMLPPGAWDMP